MARYVQHKCDLCFKDATRKLPDTSESPIWGRFYVKVKKELWNGSLFGYVCKKLDVCVYCMREIVTKSMEKRSE